MDGAPRQPDARHQRQAQRRAPCIAFVFYQAASREIRCPSPNLLHAGICSRGDNDGAIVALTAIHVTACLAQLSRTGSGTPSDTSGFEARLSALGRPSAEGSGEGLRQASEEPPASMEGDSSGAVTAPAEADAASSPDEVRAAVPPPSAEEAADTTTSPAPDDISVSGPAAELSAAQEEPADESEPAESRGVEESDGHFTSTSHSADGLLVRRNSRGHLSNSLSSKRVSMVVVHLTHPGSWSNGVINVAGCCTATDC